MTKLITQLSFGTDGNELIWGSKEVNCTEFFRFMMSIPPMPNRKNILGVLFSAGVLEHQSEIFATQIHRQVQTE